MRSGWWGRLSIAAVAVLVGVVDAPAMVTPAGAVTAPVEQAPAVKAGPTPASEPRDLAKELSAPGGGVDVSGGRDGRAKVPQRVAERVDLRSEGSETWSTADGANVTEFFGTPKWFRDPTAGWKLVDPAFTTAADGTVSATGVGFGATISAVGGLRVLFEGRDLRSSLWDRPDAVPVVDAKDSKVAWVRDAWPGVDVRYTLSGSGISEDFVVKTPEGFNAPGVFTASVESDGALVADSRRPGGLRFDWDGNGKTAIDGDPDGPKVALSPPVVTDAQDRVLPQAKATLAFDPNAERTVQRRTRVVGVDVDETALQSLPTTSFPVTVDPSIEIIPASMGGSWASYNSAGNMSTGSNQWGLLGNWRFFGGDDYWRYALAPGYSYLWTNIAANARLFGATLKVQNAPYPTAAAPVFDANWASFPTSNTSMQVTACQASAWSYAGTYPGWGGCQDGYYYGFSWTDSFLGPYNSSSDPGLTRVDVSALVRPWVANHDPNGVLGVSVPNVAGFNTFHSTVPSLELMWDTPSPAAPQLTPADGSTITGTTPTLSWGAVTDPDTGQSPTLYRPVLFASTPTNLGADPTTGCNANQAIWAPNDYSTATSVTVPAGILQDGVTYTWSVATTGNTFPAVPTCSGPAKFKVDRRLGSSGPAPIQSFGPIGVNLATGNVVAGAGTHSIPTVGGEIGLQFAYNSQAKTQNGLRGQYFMGTDPSAQVAPPLSFKDMFAQRVDDAIDFDWGSLGPKNAALDNFLARWTGYVTVPTAGAYCFGTYADDGTRVWVDNTLVLDNWVNQPATDKPCTTSVTFAAGETKSIRVEYYDQLSSAVVKLKTYSGGVGTVVPTGWLSTDVPVLGPGWTMSDGDVSVSGARATGAGVTLTMGDGSTVEYKKSDTGAYVGPVGDGTVVRVDPVSGQISVVDDAGTTYTYSTDGLLLSAVAAPDDRNPAATQMTWTGNTAKLTSMKDPVSNQSFTLRYGGDASCATPPSGFQISAGLLCRVESWDGRATDLFYNQGRLERVVNPGGVRTEYTYDTSNQLTSVTEPLANDATDAGSRTDDESVTWQVTYAGTLASIVTAPAPTTGATRQTFTMNYDSAATSTTPGVSRVTASGLSAPNGFTKKVAFDTSYRTVSTWDDGNQRTDITYDGTSDRVAYTDTNVGTPQALRSSTVYDTSVVFNGLSRPIATYGPAPVASFTGATPNGGAVVPTSTTAYDGGINGLSAAYWDDSPQSGETYTYPGRPAFRGAPKVHALQGGDIAWNWASGSPDPAIPVDNFSARFSGLINLATAGNYSFGVLGDDGARLTIDDKVLADTWTTPSAYVESAATAFTAGWHRITIEYREDTATASLSVNWLTPGAGSRVTVPAASLKPDLGLVTSSTGDAVDNTGTSTSTTTTNSYANPVVGLQTQSVVDPTGLKLTSGASFETQGGAGSFLRKLTSTLPAGYDAAGASVAQPGGGSQAATTNYTYYGATEAGPTTTGCTGVATNQAGRMKQRIKADPDGTGTATPITEEFAYDTSGRTVATRTVGDAAWSCTTYDTRGRPTIQTYPAFTNPADATLNTTARTVTTTYAVAGNPFRTQVSDPNTPTPIGTTVDLLGRVTDYTDSSGYTTTNAYDTTGRVTTVTIKNPSAVTVETLGYTYNTTGPAVNDLATVTLDATQIAAVSYDAIGRATGYTYANGTTGTATFDTTYQRPSGLSFALGATPITSDAVTRDPRTGMITDQSVDGVDANPAGANFGYDRAGRLVSWWGKDPASGNKYQGLYNFTSYLGTAPGCANTQWGRNSNRLSFQKVTYNSAGTLLGTTVDQTCYDNADRLSSYLPASGANPYAGVTYDTHGSTIKMGTETHGYDSADRHLVSKQAATRVDYVRDAADRITTPKLNGTTIARYAYTAAEDTPALTLDAAGTTVVERTITLPGGVLVTKRGIAATDVWSYANLHGDVTATTNGSGVKNGATKAYDPYGNPLGTTTLPDNATGNLDYAWHGTQQRPLEHETGYTPLIEMGARQYDPVIGRFIETDPVEGGCDNDYVYPSDPVNSSDLDGRRRRRVRSNPSMGQEISSWTDQWGRRIPIRRGTNSRRSMFTVDGRQVGRFGIEKIRAKHVGPFKDWMWDGQMMADVGLAIRKGSFYQNWFGSPSPRYIYCRTVNFLGIRVVQQINVVVDFGVISGRSTIVGVKTAFISLASG